MRPSTLASVRISIADVGEGKSHSSAIPWIAGAAYTPRLPGMRFEHSVKRQRQCSSVGKETGSTAATPSGALQEIERNGS
jgi:hypothetical protein